MCARERLGRRAVERLFEKRERREFQSLMLSTAQRYEEFKKDYAPVMDRIPQYLIAGYLGVTPVALSRALNKNQESVIQV